MATVAPHVLADDELGRRKAALRHRARMLRLALSDEERVAAGERLRAHLLAWLSAGSSRAVAGFWPLGGEVDLKPLLRAWHETGRTALLPRVTGKERPLQFLEWTPRTVLTPGAFAVDEPPSDAPVREPDVVLVPLLAVDDCGHRLGYGGGYYDRTLAMLADVTAVGVAFDVQRVDAVPVGVHDYALTHLATESGIVTFDRGASR